MYVCVRSVYVYTIIIMVHWVHVYGVNEDVDIIILLYVKLTHKKGFSFYTTYRLTYLTGTKVACSSIFATQPFGN